MCTYHMPQLRSNIYIENRRKAQTVALCVRCGKSSTRNESIGKSYQSSEMVLAVSCTWNVFEGWFFEPIK